MAKAYDYSAKVRVPGEKAEYDVAARFTINENAASLEFGCVARIDIETIDGETRDRWAAGLEDQIDFAMRLDEDEMIQAAAKADAEPAA